MRPRSGLEGPHVRALVASWSCWHLLQKGARGLGAGGIGGREIAVEDLEIRNREPSRRVRPRRDQRARDDVVDPVAIDRWRAAVVIANGRGKAGLDPAAPTVLARKGVGRGKRG